MEIELWTLFDAMMKWVIIPMAAMLWELENESIFIGPPCWCFWRLPLLVEQQEFSVVDGQQ